MAGEGVRIVPPHLVAAGERDADAFQQVGGQRPVRFLIEQNQAFDSPTLSRLSAMYAWISPLT